MFLYSFTNHFGYDRVAIGPEKIPKKHKLGDLLWVDKNYALLLWEEVSFLEQYNYHRRWPRDVIEYYPKFFFPKTVKMIHRMRDQRFSPYKKIIPLYLDQDLDYLLQKKSNKKGPKDLTHTVFSFNKKDNIILQTTQKKSGQQLIVFPDLWTLYNMVEVEKLESDSVILTSQSTKLQQAKAFWGVSNGTISTIVTTFSNMFQNRKQLESMTIVHPEKRYYNNQQEPRYKSIPTLKKMAEIYWADLSTIN